MTLSKSRRWHKLRSIVGKMSTQGKHFPSRTMKTITSSKRASAGLFLIVLLILLGGYIVQSADSHESLHADYEWLNHGNGLLNNRDAVNEHKISKKSAPQLSLKWEFIARKDITATPAISEGVVYFPCWGGNLYAVRQDMGDLVWQKDLRLLTGATPIPMNATVLARATPTIYGDVLLLGIYGPCLQMAINKTTGDLLWQRTLDYQQYATITMSGQAFEGFYYIGTSSMESGLPASENCCSFQGAFYKLSISTGEVAWRVPMLPDNGGKTGLYAGASVWGSTPPIDVKRRAVYIATGNAYSTPPNITACELARQNLTNPPTPDPCLVYDNHQESMLSISIDSGEIKWATKLGPYDTWRTVCLQPPESPERAKCPPAAGNDSDFGEAPMLLSIRHPAGGKKAMDILVAGEKNGFVWALDAATGSVIWSTDAGPGGSIGGASWGMATDGELVFTNIINNRNVNFTLVPSTEVITTGGWVALEAATGKIVWSAANPFLEQTVPPVTHVNGVLLVGSTSISAPGAVVGLDAKTGKVLWTRMTNGTVSGGFSVANGCGFVGTGLSSINRISRRVNSTTTLNDSRTLNAYCVN